MRYILVLVLVSALAGGMAGIAKAEKRWSFVVIPGVALGPVQLEMNFARALTAMPERPTKVERVETYDPATGVVLTTARVTWDRVKPEGEGTMNVYIKADFADGHMKSTWGNDDRLSYRGKNIADLRMADFIVALGPPDKVRDIFGGYAMIWDSRGIIVAFEDRDDGEKVAGIGIFRPGRFAKDW